MLFVFSFSLTLTKFDWTESDSDAEKRSLVDLPIYATQRKGLTLAQVTQGIRALAAKMEILGKSNGS